MSNRQDKFQGLLRDQADMCRLEDSDHVADLLDEAADAIASLQARLDAAEKDAARYRWLRGKWINGQEETGLEPVMHCFTEDECDAALDGAMGAA